jgi:hypothetical protein
MLVILLLLLLLSLQGTGWLLLAMVDPPIGRTAANCTLASVAATTLLYKLLRDISNQVLITAALIVVRLCQYWVHTSLLDPLADYGTDIVYYFGLNLRRGRTKIHIKTTEYICA